MAMIGWLVVFVALVGIEVGTMALTTIWFAGGALAAFFMALAGLSFQVQMTVFLAVSFVLLIFTRPFAVKYVNKGTVRTPMWTDLWEKRPGYWRRSTMAPALERLF